MVDRRGIFGTVANASFILVLITAFLFLYAWSFTDNSIIFGELSDQFFKIYTVYLVGFSLVLSGMILINPQVVRRLAKISLWKSFVFRFLPSAVVTSLFLILIKVFIKGSSSTNIFSAIASISFPVLLTHFLVVSQMEELMFGGLIYTSLEGSKKQNRRNANIITTILFSLWHLAKTGGQIILLLIYVPLRYWWNYVRNNGTWPLNKIPGIGRKFFGSSQISQQANAGSHFGWNLFVVGFIEPFRA